jgi:hypothetical protein
MPRRPKIGANRVTNVTFPSDVDIGVYSEVLGNQVIDVEIQETLYGLRKTKGG